MWSSILNLKSFMNLLIYFYRLGILIILKNYRLKKTIDIFTFYVKYLGNFKTKFFFNTLFLFFILYFTVMINNFFF